MIKLNQHSKIASLYRYFYVTTKLPNSLCDYFWGVIFAFCCLPITWIPMVINKINGKIVYNKQRYEYEIEYRPLPSIFGLLFSIGIIFIGGIGSGLFYGITGVDVSPNNIFTLAIFYVYGIVMIILSVISYFIITSIIKFISLFKKELTEQEKEQIKNAKHAELLRKMEKEEIKNKKQNFLKITWIYLKSIKNNYCPLITWENRKK